jgi:ribonuclease P protein component
MISRQHRFHGHNSLGFVYQKGRAVRTPQLALKFAINPRRKMYRVAVVVSRKVHKSAVVRNRIRRRVYEIVRRHEARIPGPYDLVFTTYGEQLATLPSADLEHLILELLQKLSPNIAASKQNPQNNNTSSDIDDIVNPRN